MPKRINMIFSKDKEVKTKIEDKIKTDREKIAALEKESEPLYKKLVEIQKIPNVSKIAFFARKNRDHALFVMDVNKGKFVQEIEISLDQAFSPNFSPDGRTIYFSAAKNIQRDIYSMNLDPPAGERELKNLTNGGVFNSAPRVSPDGTELVYIAFVGGFQKIFHLDIESGKKTQFTFGRWNENSPSWSSDGNIIVYTSDEKDSIWNLYTFERGETSYQSKQWTDYYGGVFTPKFVPGENDRIVYPVFLEDDQFWSYIYSNFELFDARLKEPLRISVIAPARWKFYGANVNIGTSTYWGAFASSQFAVQDILANRTHLGLYAQQGDFRYFNYTYSDRSRRWGLAANANHNQYPLNYMLYNFEGETPRYSYPDEGRSQFVLNNTWVKETSATLYAEYPFNKWSRLELGIRPRKRTYSLPLSDTSIVDFGDQIPEIDRQFYEFFKASNGQTNVGFTAAFVHDTVLFSDFGPLHGDALRAQVEYGPGLNKNSSAYLTAQVDARRYMRLSNRSLFAVHGIGLTSNRPNGDVVFLGGTDTLRNYPYFSVAGNQIGYGSAELRFPFADVALFSAIPFQLRGVFFGDYAVAQFSNDSFPMHREWAYGLGLQAYIFLPLNFEWARTKFAPDKWTFNVRVGFNF
ncbi:MAG: PD40 domain-containing protein [Candidatus Yanofskybacteria bacterium]|nr:PD40 domain-containing protein [Candidatus Yanofskybacteria bacterium]